MWVKRAPWALLLSALLLLGAIDWHPAGEGHDPLASAQEEVYFPGASHPEEEAHFEHAEPAHRPACQVCLHRQQTSGAHLRPAPAMAPPVPQGAERWELVEAPQVRSCRTSGARAPPSFS